jgi:hypothetical protein
LYVKTSEVRADLGASLAAPPRALDTVPGQAKIAESPAARVTVGGNPRGVRGVRVAFFLAEREGVTRAELMAGADAERVTFLVRGVGTAAVA